LRIVAESDVVKLYRSAQLRDFARAWSIPDLALHINDFADPFICDGSPGVCLRHLRRVLHRLVHLAEVPDKQDKRPRGKAACQDQPRSKPKHQPGADGDNDFNQWRKPGFDAARPQRNLDVFQAFFFQAMHLVVLTRKSLDYAHGGKHFLNYGGDLAFFLTYLPGGLLDAARVLEYHERQKRRHRESDQRKAPVDIA